MDSFYSFVAFFIFFAISTIHASPPPTSKIVGIDEHNQFIDEFGRQRFFRGLNVMNRRAPYYPVFDKFDPIMSFSERDAQILASVNMNVIRLGVLWIGVEPERGQYDDNYLNIMKGIADTCNKYGIYVLLDSHQDVFSEKFCGDGFPFWAAQPGILPFPQPVGNTANYSSGPHPVPDAETCHIGWERLYLSNAVNTAFQNVYDNKDGLLDAFANQWALISKKFKGTQNLLGLDIINEPWPGNVYQNPLLFNPSYAEKKNLQNLYEIVNTAVRKVDQDVIFFYEGVTWDILGNGFSVPGGNAWKNKSALSFHYYKPPDVSEDATFTVRNADIARTGGGRMLTEFATSWYNGTQDATILYTMQRADVYQLSWMGWQYKDYYTGPSNDTNEALVNKETGEVRDEVAKLFSRTYAEAVAGVTNRFEFNDTSGGYTLIFILNTNIKAPTVIRVQEKYYYPNGYVVNVQPAGKLKESRDSGGFLYLDFDSGAKTGDVVTVNITAN